MDKNELMEIARGAGGAPLIEGTNTLIFSPIDIERLANAILERAAVECDSRANRMRTGCTQEKEAINCGNTIRSLKIKDE